MPAGIRNFEPEESSISSEINVLSLLISRFLKVKSSLLQANGTKEVLKLGHFRLLSMIFPFTKNWPNSNLGMAYE